MFSFSFDYSNGQPFTNGECVCISVINLRRSINHTHREWSDNLPMEHRPNHSKHYCCTKRHHNLFRRWNELQWLFENGIRNGHR